MSAVRLTLSDTNAEAAETWVDAMGIFGPLKEQQSAIFDRIVQHPSQKLPKSQPVAARTVTEVLRITIEAFSIIADLA